MNAKEFDFTLWSGKAYNRLMPPLTKIASTFPRKLEFRQEATLINSFGQDFPVHVKNLSRAGFTLEHRAEDLRLGEIVILRSHLGTQARCEITWTTEAEAGGVFIELPVRPTEGTP